MYSGEALTNCDDASSIRKQAEVIVQETSPMEQRQSEAKYALKLLLQGVYSGPLLIGHLFIDLMDVRNVVKNSISTNGHVALTSFSPNENTGTRSALSSR